MVYKLKWDFSHVNDLEVDAFHVPFDNSRKLTFYFANPISYKADLLPKTISFEADFSIVSKIDFPINDLRIPVISLRMLSVLKNVGHFEYTEIPVVMIDDISSDDRFDDQGKTKPNIPTLNTFVAVRLSNLYDYFDFDHSIYEPMKSNPDAPGVIKKLVIKRPKNDFPPIFLVRFLNTHIFISKHAKEALEKADIQGCIYEEVEVSE